MSATTQSNNTQSDNNNDTNFLVEDITRYDNGAIKEIKYKDTDDKLQGHYKRFYQNGLMCISCSYSNDKRIGKCLEFEEDGKLWKQCIYNKDGKVEGTYSEWWPNGQLRMNVVCKDGNFVGKYKTYWSNGNLWETGFCTEEGKKDDVFQSHSEDGITNTRTYYTNGVKQTLNQESKDTSKVQDESEDERICVMLPDGKTIRTTSKKFFGYK